MVINSKTYFIMYTKFDQDFRTWELMYDSHKQKLRKFSEPWWLCIVARTWRELLTFVQFKTNRQLEDLLTDYVWQFQE